MVKQKELFLPILKDGKYGFINKNKDIVIKPKFKYVSERFKDGYCVITYIKKESIYDKKQNYTTIISNGVLHFSFCRLHCLFRDF